jgi:hypothetical protein
MSRTRRKIPPEWSDAEWIDGYDPARDHDSYGRHIPNYLKRYIGIGSDNYGCACCFPGPKSRKEKIRSAKRKEKREAMKQILDI